MDPPTYFSKCDVAENTSQEVENQNGLRLSSRSWDMHFEDETTQPASQIVLYATTLFSFSDAALSLTLLMDTSSALRINMKGVEGNFHADKPGSCAHRKNASEDTQRLP